MKARTKISGSLVEIVDTHDVPEGDLCLVRYLNKPETSEFWIFTDNLEFESDTPNADKFLNILENITHRLDK